MNEFILRITRYLYLPYWKLRVILLLSCVFSVCCAFYSDTRCITLIIPEMPSHWQGLLPYMDFKVCFPDGKGGVEEVFFTGPSESDTVKPLPIRIRIPKAAWLPIIVRPLYRGHDGLLKPAEGFAGIEEIPVSENREKISDGPFTVFPKEVCRVSWKVWPLASTVLKAYKAGFPIEKFNVPKVINQVKKEGITDYFYLEESALLNGLERQCNEKGTFSARDIKLKKTRLINIKFPCGKGGWISCCAGGTIHSEQSMAEMDTVPGVYRFINTKSGKTYVVHVPAEGEVYTYIM